MNNGGNHETNDHLGVLGGGTGLFTALAGLRRHEIELTAIVTMADSGGSSGRRRDEFGYLPAGDVRRCLVALAAVIYWLYARHFEETDDAQIDGNISNIGPRVSGTVTNVFVLDNQLVKAGDPLLEIDPTALRVARAQAKASVAQAEALDAMLAERGKKIDLVLELKVDDAVLLSRVEARIKAGGVLRSDDTPETLAHRLGVYYRNTAPLIDFYRGQGKLKSVDGMAPVDQVTAQIAAILDGGPAGN